MEKTENLFKCKQFTATHIINCCLAAKKRANIVCLLVKDVIKEKGRA